MLRVIKNNLVSIFYKIINSEDYNTLVSDKLGIDTDMFKRFGTGSALPAPCIIKNPQYISIGNNFTSLYNLRLEAWDQYAGQHFHPSLVIGDNVNMNTDCHIGCIELVEIGNNVLIASRVYISDHSHGDISAEALAQPPVDRPLRTKGPVRIEDNVWLGEGVCVLPGVTIGRNAIVGANAVVTRNVPANSVVGGNPARIIKQF